MIVLADDVDLGAGVKQGGGFGVGGKALEALSEGDGGQQGKAGMLAPFLRPQPCKQQINPFGKAAEKGIISLCDGSVDLGGQRGGYFGQLAGGDVAVAGDTAGFGHNDSSNVQ